MPAKEGRLPSSGQISVSDINIQAGLPENATTNLGDSHMRAFQGNRKADTTTSLGDARGRAVTAERQVEVVINKKSYYFVRSGNLGNPSTLSTFSLSEEFHPSQMEEGFPLYITSELTEDWWGPLNDPRNITIEEIGTNRTVEHGGTGGRKNYYCETKYDGTQSLSLRGWYGGKSTDWKVGRVNVRHLSLVDEGPGKLS